MSHTIPASTEVLPDSEDDEEEERAEECGVCMDNLADGLAWQGFTVVYPTMCFGCGKSVCGRCAPQLVTCPYCTTGGFGAGGTVRMLLKIIHGRTTEGPHTHRALCTLGNLHRTPDDDEFDVWAGSKQPADVEGCYRKASDNGFLLANHLMAKTTRSKTDKLFYLARGVAGGCPMAEYWFANHLTDTDSARALQLYTSSAKKGCPASLLQLSTLAIKRGDRQTGAAHLEALLNVVGHLPESNQIRKNLDILEGMIQGDPVAVLEATAAMNDDAARANVWCHT
jgi:hypothetical protein